MPHGSRFGGLDELDALGRELVEGPLDVVAGQRAGKGRPWPGTVVGREQHETGVGRADAELDPALRSERLIGVNLESEPFGVERERAILIGGGDADELDVGDHARMLPVRFPGVKPIAQVL